ncbi:MAG: glycosyltransferase family 9 protein [Rhodospirillales bacterium]|nr:glycosyltransferase family 9 protein [Rhodospirillales bacterium]
MTATRILVIRLGAFGDFILSLGAFAAIRAHHAGAHIVLLTTRPYAALASSSPYFDAVWIDERPKAWQVGRWLALRARLKQGAFDRVYDLQTSDRSGFYFRLMGPGRRPEWSGIAPGCSHPHANPGRDSMHTLDRQAEQLGLAGIPSVPAPDLAWLNADLGRFGLPSRYVLLVPGGAMHRPAKRWPADRFIALAKAVAAQGLAPVVIGALAERPLGQAIKAAEPKALDLTGTTSFADIASLARGALVAIGNDTGPMHLIAAVGARVLVLFSRESDPALCAPRGPHVAVLRVDDLATLPLASVLERLRFH